MTPLSIVSLARGGLGHDKKQKALLVLSAYFDDSGTHNTASVVSIGGALGTDDQWSQFEGEWRGLLRQHGLSAWHSTDCQAGRGEFSGRNFAEREHLTYLFRRVIIDLRLITIAVAADASAWREVVRGGQGNADEYCFQRCIELTTDTSRTRYPGEKLAIYFDKGVRKSLSDWAQEVSFDEARYPEISGFTLSKVSELLPLQCSDMIATETYWFGQEWLKDRTSPKSRPHFEEFRQRDLSCGYILDREHIEAMVRHSERFFVTPPSHESLLDQRF